MGPYQATGSFSGRPEMSRKRRPAGPASTATSSPGPKSTSVWSPASAGGLVSDQPSPSLGTASGPEALQNLPAPSNTYANALRPASTGNALRLPGGSDTSR